MSRIQWFGCGSRWEVTNCSLFTYRIGSSVAMNHSDICDNAQFVAIRPSAAPITTQDGSSGTMVQWHLAIGHSPVATVCGT